MKDYKEYLKTVYKFAGWYNDIAKKDNPLTAISVLSQNREELEAEFENQIENFNRETLDGIENFVSVKEDDNDEVKKAVQTVRDSLDQTFPYSILLPFFEVDKQVIREELKNFWELTGKQRFVWVDEQYKDNYLETIYHELDLAYKAKEEIETLQQQEMALGYIIEKGLLNDYPKDILKHINDEEAKDRVKGNSSKQGRKYDKSAPKKELDDYVIEIIKKGKNKETGYASYWHHTEPNKDTPNKKQIKEHLLKLRKDKVTKAKTKQEKFEARKESLIGELGRHGVKKRVKKAVSEHWY